MFNPGFPIKVDHQNMQFEYGADVFGPEVERRHLNDIRQSLLNPNASGPDIVYSIAMDVGLDEDALDLQQRHLLYGVVTYAPGRIGDEPVRSQGHIHSISKSCNYSTAEVYEVWTGKCIVLMQEQAKDDPGRVFAIYADPGQILVVPPGWAHETINADSNTALTFGAWCIRDYGFEYADVRKHHGLAFYPILDADQNITWQRNNAYQNVKLIEKAPQDYQTLGVAHDKPIYQQYHDNKHAFDFVTKPRNYMEVWNHYEP